MTMQGAKERGLGWRPRSTSMRLFLTGIKCPGLIGNKYSDALAAPNATPRVDSYGRSASASFSYAFILGG